MLNCIIIDDEPLARKGLREYLLDVDFLHLSGEFGNPLKAMTVLEQEKIDLVFLDIQMPKLTGLEFIKTLKTQPLVIFTTAYPQYAVEGFDLDAVDYLVKPFSFDRFLKAAMKAKMHVENARQPIHEKTDPAYFFIKSDNKLVKVLYDDLLFVEALQNYVAVHSKDKKLITYLTFKSVEEHLPPDRFLKIHKSYIVSIEKIDSIEGNEVKIGSHSLPISRSIKEEVMEKILQNRYLKR
ncbi:MAG TPA: LytTR family DNA-binding domain-containing protein [Puia sp.]|nr:LytTR family DNA-binding domain-containing protein [Puia sp.]